MKLTDKDYREIASRIQIGCNEMEYEKDGEKLFLDYELDIEGYVEDDRENGTGGFVETSRYFSLNGADAFDDDGNETPCEVDKRMLERLIA